MEVESPGWFCWDTEMKNCLAPMFAALLLVGCADKPSVPVPNAAMAERSGEDVAILNKGHAVYTTHCARCHEPMMPSEVSSEDWHVVVPGMAWNAGISEADEDAVLKYILAAR